MKTGSQSYFQPAYILAVLASIGTAVQCASAGSWLTNSPLITGRYGHTATPLTNGQVLVVGGLTSAGDTTSAELYDPVTGIWTNADATHDVRFGHTATLLNNGKVLVTGGQGPTGIGLSSTELFDPVTQLWETNNPLNGPRLGHTATLLLDGRVLVTGGYAGLIPTGTSLPSSEIFDPVTGLWTVTGSLTTPRYVHTATLLPSGKVLVAGGIHITLLASAEVYDPNVGNWTPTAPMSVARRYHTASLLPSGKVLVVGGAGPSDTSVEELYDPSTGSWATTGSMNYPRNLHTATLLPDGRIMVAGGWSASGIRVTATEVFDAATEGWTPVGQLNAARTYHSANLLPNGSVLVVGGYGTGGAIFGTEFYVEATSINLDNPVTLPSGDFQFSFTNLPGFGFSVLAAANPAIAPSNWTVIGSATEISPGQFQFTDTQATNSPQRFYRVRAN